MAFRFLVACLLVQMSLQTPPRQPSSPSYGANNGDDLDLDIDLIGGVRAFGRTATAAALGLTALGIGLGVSNAVAQAAASSSGTVTSSLGFVVGRKKRSSQTEDREELSVALHFFDMAAELDGRFKCLPKVFCKMAGKDNSGKLPSLEKAVLKLEKKIPGGLRHRFSVTRPGDMLIYGTLLGEVGKAAHQQQAVCIQAFPTCKQNQEELLAEEINRDLEALEKLH